MPVLTPAETRALLDRIDVGTVVGLRARALLSVMVYNFARVSAAVGMRRQDYFRQGTRGWLAAAREGRQAGPALSGRPLACRVVLAMSKRQAAVAGLPASMCCHTFRSPGSTGRTEGRSSTPNGSLAMSTRGLTPGR